MKFSELTPEQQVKVLRVLVGSLYERYRELLVEMEFDRDIRDAYGTTLMTEGDRLNNRLMVDLVISDNGIPPHDHEARQWLEGVIDGRICRG